MIAELRVLETKTAEEWNTRNKKAKQDHFDKEAKELDDKWKAGTLRDEEKFKADPKRYLQEIFLDGESIPAVITIKGTPSDHDFIETAAKELGLFSDITRAPEIAWCGPVLVQQSCVVGRSQELVKERIIEQRRLAIKRTREWREKSREEERAPKRQRMEDPLARCKDWDVTGRWKISCARLEENYANDCADGLTQDIHQEDKSKGILMYAEFDFGIVKGVFRFERQKQQERASFDVSVYEGGSDQSPSNEQESAEKRNDGEVDKFGRPITSDNLYLGKTIGASKKNSVWKYRWRGEETDKGEVLSGSEKDAYTIIFQEPRGFTLMGTFGCDLIPEEFAFTGGKIEPLGYRDRLYISDAWTGRSAKSQERVRVDRWR